MGIYACPRCGNPNGWWSGDMRDVHDCPVKPVAVEFTPDEAKAGRAMRGNTLHYCCYGMYCDVGHSSDCQFAHGVKEDRHQTFCTDTPTGERAKD